MSDDSERAGPAPRKSAHRGRRIVLIAVAVVLAVVAGLLLAVRFGVLAPGARVMIEARTDGLEVGRLGRLKLEGLSGDVWRDFTIDRVTLSDDTGVWLEAREVRVTWDYPQLLQRRFVADLVAAEHVRLIRRPELGPKSESRGLPVSFDIARLAGRVEMSPAFSYERGVYDVTGELHVGRRNSGQSGQLHAVSQLHPGDRLDAQFSFGGDLPLLMDVQAHEARGGALAGAVGLPSDQAFDLNIQARGQRNAGHLVAAARTGGTQPLSAQGRWSADGARAKGRLDLTASSLTRPLADALGPNFAFELVAAREGRLYDARLTVDAANLGATVSGLVDAKARTTGSRGLAVRVRTPDAGDLASRPEMGPAEFVGTLTGGLDDWRLAGELGVQAIATEGYRLARLGGPLALQSRRDGLRFETRLHGDGGAGDGALAALLGRAPTAELTGARLADGRLLLERLSVDGRGLRVVAKGDRGLTGALSFRGEATLTDLAALRPGAAGAVSVDWRARQRNARSPWTLTVQGRGERLDSGFDALDQLLGPTPRLQAAATFQDGVLTLSEATVNGARVGARLHGAIGGAEGLRLNANWQATGPLGIGPVEIRGRARGTAVVTGAVDAPTLRLEAGFDTVDIPRMPLKDARLTLSLSPSGSGRSGEVALNARTPYGPAQARADLALPPGALSLDNLSLQAGGVSLSGRATLRNGAPSSADLRFAVGRGALLASGRAAGALQIVGGPGDARATLDVTLDNAAPYGVDLTITEARLRATGPLDQLAYELTARGDSPRDDWSVRGDGRLSQAGSGYMATFSGGGALGEETVRTVRPAVLRFGGEARTADVALATGRGGTLSLQGRLTDATAALQARVSNVSLAVVNPDLAGRLTADVTLEGRGRRLSGRMDARLADARAEGSDPAGGLDARVEGRLVQDQLHLIATATNEQGLRARADVTLAAEASAAPLRLALRRDRPIRGEITADGQVRPLWDLLVGGERALSGEVDIDARLAGTLADPRLRGRATVRDGRFVDGATGVVLQQAQVRATFTDDAVQILEARGVDGAGGAVSGSGRISLMKGGVSSLSLQLGGFQVIDNDLATARASGPIKVERAASGRIAVTGRLRIDSAEISPTALGPPGVVTVDVVEINKPARLQRRDPAPAAGSSAVDLDIALQAPGRIFVRGRGLDVELALDARVTGSVADPTLSGEARIVRGDYSFAGKRFEFDERGVIRLATDPEDIRLDLSARRVDPTLTAIINVRGTAARPEISLSSSPSLPEDEVLSQVLFGRSASRLSTLEAARLAAALSSLSGGGGFNVLGDLRALTGLDRLSFLGGEGGGFAVAGGKYLSDDVYLEIIGGGRDGPAVEVEWRLSRRFWIVSRVGGQGGTDIAVRWRKAY